MNNLNLIMTLSEAIDALRVAEEKLLDAKRASNQYGLKKRDSFRAKINRQIYEMFEQTGDNATTLSHILGRVQKRSLERIITIRE